jgi:hypothetical protein
MYVHIYLMIVTLSECKYFALIFDNFHNICWDNFHNICWDNFHNICWDNFHNICWFYASHNENYAISKILYIHT